jgi:hypothetical protein
VTFDDSEFEEKRRQWNTVEDFFKSFEDPDGSLTGGVNHYKAPDDFRRHFELHLRDHLTALAQTLQTADADAFPPSESQTQDKAR